MTSRVDFTSIEYSSDIMTVKNSLFSYRNKNIIIMKDEEIMGTINKHIFFEKLLKNEITNIMHEINPPKLFSSHTKIDKLLEYFSTKKQNIVFVEENEDIIGLVTLTDIISEIVGQIEIEDYFYQKTEHGSIIDGSYLIRQLNKKMNWTLPETHLTINGFILSIAYKIPALGSKYEYRDDSCVYIFEILETAQNVSPVTSNPPQAWEARMPQS